MVVRAIIGAEEAAVEFADYQWSRLRADVKAASNALVLASRAADPRWVERHLESAEAILQAMREYNRAYRMRRRLS